ncbi:acyl-CoA thioesterase [Planctomycetota bacterium]
MSSYIHQTTVRICQTDAAGVVYFAEYFNLAHHGYEAFLDEIYPVNRGFDEGILLPIVHAEADYHQPLRVSQKITSELVAKKIKRTSFTLGHTIKTQAGEVAARVTTIHAAIDANWKSVRIPAPLRSALEAIQVPNETT